MTVTGKVIKWSNGHRDYYMYDNRVQAGEWIKVWCTLTDMDCTSPFSYPRGTKFDRNFKVSGKRAESMQDQFEHLQQRNTK